jgi:hypothetical protein
VMVKEPKIIQIAICAGDENTEDRFVALRDDGTLWITTIGRLNEAGKASWYPVSTPPSEREDK